MHWEIQEVRNNLKNISEISPDEFSKALHIRLYPGVVDFVLTRIGRVTYAINTTTGIAYTRPQLIEAYRNSSAQHPTAYLVTADRK